MSNSISRRRTPELVHKVTGRMPEFHNGQGDGGANRDRTDDLKLAKLALSQLSYGPDASGSRTPRLLPATTNGTWWAWEDLNFRPHAYQARALTN